MSDGPKTMFSILNRVKCWNFVVIMGGENPIVTSGAHNNPIGTHAANNFILWHVQRPLLNK